MSHEFQPEETGAQQIGTLTAPPAAPEAETEHDAQTARLVSERLNEIAHYARRIELNFWLSARLIGFSCVFSVAIMSFAASAQDLPTYLMGLVFCIADVVAFHHAVRARAQKMPAFDAAQIARLGGVKAIPALFAALQSPLRANHNTAIHAALKMLLPQMKASDAHFLTPASRRIIHGWLAMRYMEYGITDMHNDSRLIALKALEQVGGAESTASCGAIDENEGPNASAEDNQAGRDKLPGDASGELRGSRSGANPAARLPFRGRPPGDVAAACLQYGYGAGRPAARGGEAVI